MLHKTKTRNDEVPLSSSNSEINQSKQQSKKYTRQRRDNKKEKNKSRCVRRQQAKERNKMNCGNLKKISDNTEEVIFHHCNIMGVSVIDNFSELHSIMSQLKNYNTGVFSLNELNMDVTKPRLRYRIKKLVKSADKYCKYAHSTMQCETFHSDKKPGGTMTGVMGKWSSRFTDKGTDTQGRWSWIILNGRGNKKILIISAYRVCRNTPASAATGTAYMQQYRFQLAQGVKIPDPRRAFYQDLQKFLFTVYKKYTFLSTILMADVNEVLEEQGPLRDFLYATNLSDTIASINPTHAKYRPTFMRSGNRLDYIFTSRDLLPHITSAGHYQYKELIPTADHCGIYIKIPSDILFNSASIDVTHISYRMLQLHNRYVVVSIFSNG